MNFETDPQFEWARTKQGIGQLCVAIEMTAVHSEMKVFGYYDFKCPEDEWGDRHWDQMLCAAIPGSIKTTCRPWVLTLPIIAAMKGMERALTWCTEEATRTFSLDDAIEYILDELDWNQVATVLEQNGYNDDWLAERLEFFRKWIEFAYFDQRSLEAVYDAVESEAAWNDAIEESLKWGK